LISALVCVTTLGAVNGQIFAGARIYYAFGRDHRWYSFLGRWNARTNVPSWALVVQGLVCLVPVVFFGVSEKAFARMVVFTTPVFFFFFLLVGASLILLRRQPTDAAPFRVPLYPLTPLLFIGSSLLMLYATFAYAIENGSAEAWWAIAILILGYLLSLAEERATDKR
jgi:amino acid transporter